MAYIIITIGRYINNFCREVVIKRCIAKTGTSSKDSLSHRHIQGRRPYLYIIYAPAEQRGDTVIGITPTVYNNMQHIIS